VVTRLAIDRLRSAQARREAYVGPWLPEPLLTGPDVADDVELAESVSLAMLVVLESLSPLERAVFVLHEVFDVPFGEVARILDRAEPAVRQLGHRARDHVKANRPRFDHDAATHQRVTERFAAACAGGDLEALLRLLAPDVTLIGDAGGLAKAPRRPIEGADKVARFLLGVTAQTPEGATIALATVNGEPGLVASVDGRPLAAFVLHLADGAIQAVYALANPHKLAGLTGT
jgi:RNA polymerase sigma-70 factor (ECF subfamily)